MKFKTERISQEWEALKSKNQRLAHLLLLAEGFTLHEMEKEITLTSIYRSAEEQAELYKDVPPEKKVLNSPHMRYEAVDLRSSDFTDREIERLLNFFNQFTYLGGQKKVALYHTIAGNVAHFHVQFK